MAFRLRIELGFLETTTGPRRDGSLLPQSIGSGSTPAWPGYEVRMIFEVTLDLRPDSGTVDRSGLEGVSSFRDGTTGSV
jgi:hypothetical protein